MAGLRRRIFGTGTPESSPGSSRGHSPAPKIPEGSSADRYTLVPTKSLEKLGKHRRHQSTGWKRRNFWIFGLGGLCGVVVAGLLAKNSDGLGDWRFDSFLDVLPAGLVKDIQDIQSSEKDAVNYDSFAVGLHARSIGIEAKHPVIMIPGVISTGLESWSTEKKSLPYFRKRLWGSWSMMRALVLDKAGWKRHLMLDEETGMDPPGVKLRAAQGFDSSDFFFPGYWIWNKILENLATVGYDPTNAFTAAYDWRLSFDKYETRDQYYTRLKAHIEIAKRVTDTKAVLLSHSMGSQVLYYFLHWVEAEGYGNGGPNWVNDHIEAWINISGCMLGALKDVPAVLSGEMRDTAQLNALAVYGLEKFLNRHERAELFRHMPGISAMLPLGGEAIWGNHTWAPDDEPGQPTTFGSFLNFKPQNFTTQKNLTVNEALDYLWKNSEDWYVDLVKHAYSHQGVARTQKEVEANQMIPSKWMNPLQSRLPLAPDMKIFCFYGIGKPTERSYYYRPDTEPFTEKSSPKIMIDTSVTTTDGFVDRGVVTGDGDGTVNLLSSGYMCNKGWKMKRYNPAGINVTVLEMPHEPDRFSPRGGPNTADHVDILGRSSLNELILRVAGGKGHLIEDKVVSRIREVVERVKIYEE
ncbi:Phospholipid:diacylglycerol acyltransferase [Piedraia hortae CBS 480.64]|uniref:Phospholipid:diacylglycerol acyltransferase n=1 Tax=Piedraia hortae CBS 480.64 TaxID=1314780 RepID=A0A6A7C716_9PEZI|nr:Phospholipid:diacylglycerol acyltransferase [Piedraia hortae CBS 480.64]